MARSLAAFRKGWCCTDFFLVCSQSWKCCHGVRFALPVRIRPLSGSAVDCSRRHTQWAFYDAHNQLDHEYGCSYTVKRSYAKKAKSVSRLDDNETEVIDLEGLEASMQAAINALKYEYTNSVIARITPAALDKVTVDVDGQRYPLKQVGQIGMPNPSLIVINLSSYPQAVDTAVKALRDTNLNLNPIPEKNTIKVPIPKMSKELREKLVKTAKAHSEKTKIGIRKARQKGVAEVKQKSDVSKDSIRRLEKHIQQLTDDYTQKVDEMLKAKSNELTKGG